MIIEERESEKHYMFELVTPNKAYYNRLVELKEKYPELTYKAKGYESLSEDVTNTLAKEIKEITEILCSSLESFVSFQNFIDRKDGNWHIRLQHKWDSRFTGVGYFDVRHWNPKDHGKY